MQELYSEWKQFLLDDPSRLSLPQAFRYVGSDPISAVQSLGTTFFITNGWRVRPAELNHTLTLNGNIFTDPSGDDVTVNTLGAFNVRVVLKTSNLIDLITTQAEAGTSDWTAQERAQIRKVLGIIGTTETPFGAGHVQDILSVVTGNLDAAVTSRAAPGAAMALTPDERTAVQAKILSDATPFSGSFIDIAISSRSAAGDAMTLTAGERTQIQSKILADAIPLSGSFLDAAVSSRSSHSAAAVRDLILSDGIAFSGSFIDAAISSRSSHSAAQVAAAVWDEAMAGHSTAGTAGLFQSMLPPISQSLSRIEPVVTGNLDIAVSTRMADGSLVTLASSSADALVNAVWDEPNGEHVLTGSTGHSVYLGSVTNVSASVSVDNAAIATAVWDRSLGQHTVSGSAGNALDMCSVATSDVNEYLAGSWIIDAPTKQLIIYARDGVTILYRYDLFNSAGAPATQNVFERRRVEL